jgi:uncharacterized membrane protein YfcA
MGFLIILAIVAVISGAIATIAGFGIGSLLTPTLAFNFVATATGIALMVDVARMPV